MRRSRFIHILGCLHFKVDAPDRRRKCYSRFWKFIRVFNYANTRLADVYNHCEWRKKRKVAFRQFIKKQKTIRLEVIQIYMTQWHTPIIWRRGRDWDRLLTPLTLLIDTLEAKKFCNSPVKGTKRRYVVMYGLRQNKPIRPYFCYHIPRVFLVWGLSHKNKDLEKCGTLWTFWIGGSHSSHCAESHLLGYSA
jgi:hypothetical protein